MEHTFSIEIKSRMHVKSIEYCCSSKSDDRVLFEGSLGKLEELSMVEGKVLEIKGTKGILRIDLSEDMLRKMFSHTHQRASERPMILKHE